MWEQKYFLIRPPLVLKGYHGTCRTSSSARGEGNIRAPCPSIVTVAGLHMRQVRATVPPLFRTTSSYSHASERTEAGFSISGQ